jgi:hypothetical protein
VQRLQKTAHVGRTSYFRDTSERQEGRTGTGWALSDVDNQSAAALSRSILILDFFLQSTAGRFWEFGCRGVLVNNTGTITCVAAKPFFPLRVTIEKRESFGVPTTMICMRHILSSCGLSESSSQRPRRAPSSSNGARITTSPRLKAEFSYALAREPWRNNSLVSPSRNLLRNVNVLFVYSRLYILVVATFSTKAKEVVAAGVPIIMS